MSKWMALTAMAMALGSASGPASSEETMGGNFLKYGSAGAAVVAGKLVSDEMRNQNAGRQTIAQPTGRPIDGRGFYQAGPISVVVSTGSGELGPMTKSLVGFFKNLSGPDASATPDTQQIEDDSILEKATSSNSALLRKNLNKEIRDSGNSQFPEDPEDCDAHHIVPAKENRPFAASAAKKAREAIDGCVDIDSAENGVYLPSKKSGANCQGSYHKTLHNSSYYETVSSRLDFARSSGGCDRLRLELKQIKNELMAGVL